MSSLLRRLAVPALAVLLVAVGLTGWWAAYDARTAPAVQNLAVHDTAATTEVREAVSRALVSVLSYDHADPAASAAAADRVLSGAAREEYDQLVATLHEKAPGQQLVLTAEVQAVGVKELTEDSAELLVLLDQSSRRVDDQEASISAAQLAVEARRAGDRWQITGLTPL